MKFRILVLSLAVLIAGCSGGEQESATTSAKHAAAAVANAPSPCPPVFYSPLPDVAIVFDFPFQIARDRVYTTDSDGTRRGLTIEYLEGDSEQVWASIKKSMTEAGFRQVGDITNESKGTFSKQGKPSIYVGVTSGPIQSPTSPDTKGSIWMSWSLK